MILISLNEIPYEVVGKALKKIHRVEGEPELSQDPNDYILKVPGSHSYSVHVHVLCTCSYVCTYRCMVYIQIDTCTYFMFILY